MKNDHIIIYLSDEEENDPDHSPLRKSQALRTQNALKFGTQSENSLKSDSDLPFESSERAGEIRLNFNRHHEENHSRNGNIESLNEIRAETSRALGS